MLCLGVGDRSAERGVATKRILRKYSKVLDYQLYSWKVHVRLDYTFSLEIIAVIFLIDTDITFI